MLAQPAPSLVQALASGPVVASPREGPPSAAETILAVVDRERHRLAQRLHDTVCQSLSAAHLQARIAIRRLPQSLPGLADDFDELGNMLRETGADLQRLTENLHRDDFTPEDLPRALTALGKAARERIPCEVFCSEIPGSHDGRTSWHLYQIGLAAVENALNHAQAGRLRIYLEVESPQGAICLKISDDGRGFEAAAQPIPTGSGFHLMQCRAEVIGAFLSVESRPGAGASVHCRRPAPPPSS